MVHELADTLTRLIESLAVTPVPGIVITGAEIDFPLEIGPATRKGQLVFYGSAPHTRWRSGILPEVHMAKMRIEAEEA